MFFKTSYNDLKTRNFALSSMIDQWLQDEKQQWLCSVCSVYPFWDGILFVLSPSKCWLLHLLAGSTRIYRRIRLFLSRVNYIFSGINTVLCTFSALVLPIYQISYKSVQQFLSLFKANKQTNNRIFPLYNISLDQLTR